MNEKFDLLIFMVNSTSPGVWQINRSYSKSKTSRGVEGTKIKRAAKIGFSSLYAYLEHKLEKSALAVDAKAAQLERSKINKGLARTAKAEKKSCDCC